MSISNLNATSGAARPSLSVDDFRREAALGQDLHVQIDGESYKLVATGSTPSGRSVAWVEGDGDATRMFVEALASSYGASLSRAVADELGLKPSPGKPLSARTVTQALGMIETAQEALGGVRFAEQFTRNGPTGNGDDPKKV
ncbi:hypothetical protein [Propionivibrio soli]|uniref:hypothetical protein n=1 Tax=Propionivibrio soli TaxID=2976531 RepID=UPI0021E7F91E|nr:hypothetical protein [Propionivibrio soli]